MKYQIILGIDNGVSGSIGVIKEDYTTLIPVPTISQQSYTKKKANITRIDFHELVCIIGDALSFSHGRDAFAFLERPMVNPMRFQASASALRAHEATLIALEHFSIGYKFIDSKEWQKAMLPEGIKGTPELKKASLDIGIRTCPYLTDEINKQGDADGLLIALYAHKLLNK